MYFHYKILFLACLLHVNMLSGQFAGEEQQLDPAMKISKNISSLGRKLIAYLESVSKSNENLLISPTNIFHAVTLLHLAAEGVTLKELSDLIGFQPAQNYLKTEIHFELSSFYENISTTDEDPVILNIADAFFLRDCFPVKENYLEYVVKHYGAKIENINFHQGKEAADKINHWVSDQTRSRISKIVDENIDPETKALIISTLYYNARWRYPFNKNHTKKDVFYTGQKEVEVQMMCLTERLLYINNEELQFESIDLQYDGSDYSLNIILPYENQMIKNLIPKLKDINIKQIMEKAKYEGVNVKLPKTKFTVFRSLVDSFKHLGVTELFIRANLSDLTTANNIRVSEIQHGVEIEIDEKGTIATAVTVVHIVPVSMPQPILEPLQFHVNRPFIINIYDTKTSLNLFVGIVYEP